MCARVCKRERDSLCVCDIKTERIRVHAVKRYAYVSMKNSGGDRTRYV